MSACTVRLLTGPEAAASRPILAEILADCVEGGASINFVIPFSIAQAEAWWERAAESQAAGRLDILGAYVDGKLVGSVQLGLDTPPNQPHRGEVRKMIVHRSARGRGIGAALMGAVEARARERGLTLLTLDTVTESDGERLYRRTGWTRAGIIPGYALAADGQDLCDTSIFWKRV